MRSASHPFDGQRARNGLDHLARRGYEFFTILRNWAAVDMTGADASWHASRQLGINWF